MLLQITLYYLENNSIAFFFPQGYFSFPFTAPITIEVMLLFLTYSEDHDGQFMLDDTTASPENGPDLASGKVADQKPWWSSPEKDATVNAGRAAETP